MIQVGEVINGKYKLVRLLGDGGMGAVYEAQHEVLGTRVAIKVLHAELARRTGLVDRFVQEAKVAAQIRSPHVVQVLDVDKTSIGTAFIVMELLEGEPLSAILDRQRRIPASTAIEYTTQILEALEAAHALGVVHRDLKPENVFVTFSGGKPVVKLIDFGIAKLRREEDGERRSMTVAGVMMGTAEYMSPEQARSAGDVDARADIYAVGVMLYEMLAGTRPVLGDDARVIALKVERGEVQPLVKAAPDAPREIAGLVHRAMAARPDLRFASATEMRLALAGAMGGKKSPAGLGATGAMPGAQVSPAAATAEVPIQGGPELQQAGTTGTLQGAPADAVMAAAASRLPAAPDVRTVMVPARPQPAQPAQQPAYIAARSVVGSDAAAARRRRQKSPRVWLFALPFIVGGGVALAVFAAGGSSGPAATPLTLGGPVKSTASAKSSAPQNPTAPTTAEPTATPDTPATTAPTRPTTTGRHSGPGHVPTGAMGDGGLVQVSPPDAGGGGTGGGNGSIDFPGIPTNLGIPTSIPTTIPTTFPFPFPGGPTAPTSQPQPTTAPPPTAPLPTQIPTQIPTALPPGLPPLPSGHP